MDQRRFLSPDKKRRRSLDRVCRWCAGWPQVQVLRRRRWIGRVQKRSIRAGFDESLAKSGFILRSAATFPWQDWNWGTPDFRDLIVYQFHVGTWYGPNRETRVAKFLDVLDRIEYLSDLGVNAIEPLPIVEYSTPRSMDTTIRTSSRRKWTMRWTMTSSTDMSG